MKNQLYTAVLVFLLPVSAVAQQKKEVKKSIEVEVVKENESTKVHVKTNENGVVKEEVFVGEEAEKKVEEIRGRYKAEEEDDKRVEVKVEVINDKKVMTVTETSSGNTSVKVYQGDEVDRKLKEMEIDGHLKEKSDKNPKQ